MRPYADNVWIRLLPLETNKGSIVLVEGDRKKKGTRRAVVVATGSGYRTKLGKFVENTVRAGDTVHVDALAGEDWSLDFDPPRHREATEFDSIGGERCEARVIREQQIYAIEGPNGEIYALNESIIVRRTEAAKMSPSGLLHIPDDAAPKPITGTVVSVGSGRAREDGKRYPIEVKPGDRVLFGKWIGTEIVVNGEALVLLREDAILGVLAEGAEVVAA